ncbi:hypothetical protein Runsl_3297 [Runella slithyformis DSM 19594]|uniref:Uncharacterized protein n=1 Tax=Runella slithyformis (strain ATCC 29530 / DSM 19594 / LMG 11500 / NCIMB 11436 / LSU 4) TaxID=761193 RepID=A0A7U3ZLZ7_RUNSL|nr:hypothetical protein Runsl_3297 [Runella slithyformis DSM 19594]
MYRISHSTSKLFVPFFKNNVYNFVHGYIKLYTEA